MPELTDFFGWELFGYRDAMGRFASGTDEARRRTREMLQAVGRILLDELRRRAPVGVHYEIDPYGGVIATKPETLKKSLTFRTFERGNTSFLKFYAAEHVKYVIYPTRPHAIRAKRGKFLRFYWPGAPAGVVQMFGGNIVYFQQVWHPGTKGNPFHKEALDAMTPSIRSQMNKAVVQVKTYLESGTATSTLS